jgi:hypothetical protein
MPSFAGPATGHFLFSARQVDPGIGVRRWGLSNRHAHMEVRSRPPTDTHYLRYHRDCYKRLEAKPSAGRVSVPPGGHGLWGMGWAGVYARAGRSRCLPRRPPSTQARRRRPSTPLSSLRECGTGWIRRSSRSADALFGRKRTASTDRPIPLSSRGSCGIHHQELVITVTNAYSITGRYPLHTKRNNTACLCKSKRGTRGFAIARQD